jgi:hypothetical protein
VGVAHGAASGGAVARASVLGGVDPRGAPGRGGGAAALAANARAPRVGARRAGHRDAAGPELRWRPRGLVHDPA